MENCLLSIENVGSPPGSILRCAGEIDLGNVEDLRRALAHSIRMGLADVDVDLMQITFLDSSAIQALLEAQRELARRSGSLRVIAGPRSAYLLRLLGLDGVLRLTEIAISARIPATGVAVPCRPGRAVACRRGRLDESSASDGERACEPAAPARRRADNPAR